MGRRGGKLDKLVATGINNLSDDTKKRALCNYFDIPY